MRNITKIFILVFSLILLLAVSCSNDDKTGVKNNPPEDMEITDGETGSGSGSGSGSETGGSGTGGSGTGGDSGTETGGGSGTGTEGDSGTETGGGSGTGTGGDSGTETGGGSGTGTGGDSGTETGGGSGTGTGGEGGTETGGETEIPEPLEEKDFPEELKGDYINSVTGDNDIQVFFNNKENRMQMNIRFIRETDGYQQSHVVRIENCTKTTKGGKIIKVKEEHGGYIITFDYEAKTISGTYIDAGGEKWSFSGTKK